MGEARDRNRLDTPEKRPSASRAPLVSLLLCMESMWKRRTKTPRPRGGIGAFLDEGSSIEGKYACSGTVLLNGELHGEVDAKDTLIVGAGGRVHASVRAGNLVVHGQIVGNVTAIGRVEIKRGGRIIGDIESPAIVMEEGAHLEGKCLVAGASPGEPASQDNVVPIAR